MATAELDDFLDPSMLHVHLEDGVGDAGSGRFDVVWTTADDYHIHYTDAGRDLRWDRHPHGDPRPSGDGHFHPPPDASSDHELVEDSAIRGSSIVLVGLAMCSLW